MGIFLYFGTLFLQQHALGMKEACLIENMLYFTQGEGIQNIKCISAQLVCSVRFGYLLHNDKKYLFSFILHLNT